jgi:hypothetical protein
MSCSGIEERVTQLDLATWNLYRLPDRELTTRFLTSNFTKHNPGLTQYECGCMKPLLRLQRLLTVN